MRILTGLKPTGSLTLGSYLGSIKQMVEMQGEDEIVLFIADLHALTIYQDPEELRKKIREFAGKVSTDILAGGLVEFEEDVDLAIEAGATAVSTNDRKLWNYR